jgi:muconolactone delta-isomerase
VSDKMSDFFGSRRGRIIFGCIVGASVFIAGAGMDTIFSQFWPGILGSWIDDLVVAIACGALVVFYEERRQRAVAKKLSVIGEMNHIVRNELEIIEYSAYATNNREHIERIRTCIGHIDWALREVRTGRKPVRGEPMPARETSNRTRTQSQ